MQTWLFVVGLVLLSVTPRVTTAHFTTPSSGDAALEAQAWMPGSGYPPDSSPNGPAGKIPIEFDFTKGIPRVDPIELRVTEAAVRQMLQEARQKKEKYAAMWIARQARQELWNVIWDPSITDTRIWINAGLVSTIMEDKNLAAQAYEAIERLTPDIAADDAAIALLASLRNLAGKELIESVKVGRRAFLADLERLADDPAAQSRRFLQALVASDTQLNDTFCVDRWSAVSSKRVQRGMYRDYAKQRLADWQKAAFAAGVSYSRDKLDMAHGWDTMAAAEWLRLAAAIDFRRPSASRIDLVSEELELLNPFNSPRGYPAMAAYLLSKTVQEIASNTGRPNPPAFVEWQRLAALNGSPWACMSYAHILPDHEKHQLLRQVRQYFELASTRCHDAMLAMAYLWNEGYGGPKDYAVAWRWNLSALRHGHPDARLPPPLVDEHFGWGLSAFFYFGTTVFKTESRGTDLERLLLQKLQADAGCPSAAFGVALKYEAENPAAALYWYRVAAASNQYPIDPALRLLAENPELDH